MHFSSFSRKRRPQTNGMGAAVHWGMLPYRMLVAEMGNAIDAACGAAPERLYRIGLDGRVAYHEGAGPHFFDLEAWEQAMAASVRALAAP